MSYCQFDWETEPAPDSRVPGKKLPKKPPPKRCTTACRRYAAPPLLQISTVRPYSAADIRQIEMDMLGVHLSSTPFDQLEEKQRAALVGEAETLQRTDTPPGTYLVAGIVARTKPHITKQGKEMAFLDLETEPGALDVLVFPKIWTKYQRDLDKGTFGLFEVQRLENGHKLLNCMPIQ